MTVIVRGGRALFLSLVHAAALVACAEAPPPQPAAAPAPTASAAPAPPPPAPVPAGSIRRSSIRRALAAGPAVFLQKIELDDHPVMVKGKFHGFRIAALRGEPSSWEGVDLRPGDVVLRVNGRSIERPQDAFDAFHSLETARELRVDCERDGAPRTLTFPIVDDEARQAPPR